MEQKVRFAIIGAGRIGQVHAENLTRRIQGAEVVAIADVVPETAERTARRFGIAEGQRKPGGSDPSR